MKVYDLIIVGAGPAGMAAAIAAKRAGLDYTILEKGVLVNSIYHFPRHMVFFTTPELLEIGGLPLVTPYEKPTRLEALRYYRRVADAFDLAVEMDRRVSSIERLSEGKETRFLVRTASADGNRAYACRCVLLAIGYYDHPNMLAIEGEDLPHVSHYYTEPHAYYRKKVLVVGGKNSAAEAALDLFRSGAEVTLVHRRAALGDSIKYWVRPDIENRIKEGSIEARFETRLVRIGRFSVILERAGEREEVPADAVFLLTGYHPDADLLLGAGVQMNPETFVPEHDPQSLETNVPGIFLAGAVVSGKETGKVFIENGRFHGETAVMSILRRLRNGDSGSC